MCINIKELLYNYIYCYLFFKASLNCFHECLSESNLNLVLMGSIHLAWVFFLSLCGKAFLPWGSGFFQETVFHELFLGRCLVPARGALSHFPTMWYFLKDPRRLFGIWGLIVLSWGRMEEAQQRPEETKKQGIKRDGTQRPGAPKCHPQRVTVSAWGFCWSVIHSPWEATFVSGAQKNHSQVDAKVQVLFIGGHGRTK
jgi:hypothetical protein